MKLKAGLEIHIFDIKSEAIEDLLKLTIKDLLFLCYWPPDFLWPGFLIYRILSKKFQLYNHDVTFWGKLSKIKNIIFLPIRSIIFNIFELFFFKSFVAFNSYLMFQGKIFLPLRVNFVQGKKTIKILLWVLAHRAGVFSTFPPRVFIKKDNFLPKNSQVHFVIWSTVFASADDRHEDGKEAAGQFKKDLLQDEKLSLQNICPPKLRVK